MNLNKKIIGRIYYEGHVDALGVTYYKIISRSHTYKLKVISGLFVTPFLMLTVENYKGFSSSDMITDPFLNYKDIIKLMRSLKNEIKDN